jgi:hypothetical protein
MIVLPALYWLFGEREVAGAAAEEIRDADATLPPQRPAAALAH